MEKISKLEEVIRKDNKNYIKIEELPKINELQEKGYNFIDENVYLAEKASYLSNFQNIDPLVAYYMVPKRNFKYEFENLLRINKLIPENSVKPIALVYDDSLKKNYVRGYITKTNGKTMKLKEYINNKLKEGTNINNVIISIEQQINLLMETLKNAEMYNKVPIGTFDMDNINVDSKNEVVLFNMNYLLSFSDINTKLHDKDIKKTIKYLEKMRHKKISYMNKNEGNDLTYF